MATNRAAPAVARAALHYGCSPPTRVRGDVLGIEGE
jgi:hypothetical protein